MKYYCDHCSYETYKKANYIRHLNRKFKCYSVTLNAQNVTPSVTPNTQNVTLNAQNVTPSVALDAQNVSHVITMSEKKHHCEICLKTFKHRNGKYKHKRNVICFPPPSPPHAVEDTPLLENSMIIKEPTTISNIQNNNQMTNSNNNKTINNNIITFNAFGDEGMKQLEEYLGEDKEIIERMKQVGKKRMYGIRDIQNDIFFNPKNPKGFSIIKPEKYGSSVRVRNNEGEFEYMEFEDVRDPMLNYIEKFINIYNKTRNKYNVKFMDPKERRILQTFLKIMNDDLDIYLNDDLKEDLYMKEESNESKNEGEDMKYKHFDKVSLDNIHVQTKKYFKCKKGEFVLNEKKCKEKNLVR
jgi:hypothetical protein